MSYDLYLLRADEIGEDPTADCERLEELAEEDEAGEPTP